MDITSRLTFFAGLFKVHENPEVGMWFLYITIIILCVIVYNLGFAKKLPMLKAAIVYICLIFGSTLLTFLAVFLPIAECLALAAVFLAIYKIRLRNERKQVGSKSV